MTEKHYTEEQIKILKEKFKQFAFVELTHRVV